jgi:HTH-type transcriptional regulator/antitoxin HigA
MENMSTALNFDEKRYGQLLADAAPRVIQTEQENERALAIIRKLTETAEQEMTPEEDALMELLVDLVHDFEEEHYPIPKSDPHKMLAYLLEEKGLKPHDLWSLLPKSRVSEILSGKRAVSKAQAKKLSEFFRVPADLFL